MRLGIIGLPGSGKTTIFNLLTGATHPVGEYLPGIHLNVGTMEIADERLEAAVVRQIARRDQRLLG